ncbi:MAG: hypothetical protein MJA31_12030 [Clostridia bacterium]|nr:hypothetical protein [Clostridia bacterium]
MNDCDCTSKQCYKEAFVLKVYSSDGCPVIVGGFCPVGKTYEAEQAYLGISKFKLGLTKDNFLIDYTLAEAITDLSPKWIKLVGASISIPGVHKRTGGIIGDPFEKNQSAKGDIQELDERLFLIALPGGPGVAYIGSYDFGNVLMNIIKKRNMEQNRMVQEVLKLLNQNTKQYLVVVDGSGEDMTAGIYISDAMGIRYETI